MNYAGGQKKTFLPKMDPNDSLLMQAGRSREHFNQLSVLVTIADTVPCLQTTVTQQVTLAASCSNCKNNLWPHSRRMEQPQGIIIFRCTSQASHSGSLFTLSPLPKIACRLYRKDVDEEILFLEL